MIRGGNDRLGLFNIDLMEIKSKNKKSSNFAKIFLVRHGDVQNPKHVLYGYLPFPLSLKGRMEAKKAGLVLRDKNIAAIFASPQKRTQESAKIISQVISKGKIKVQTANDLHETALDHLWEKLTKQQAKEKYPKIFHDYYRRPAKVKISGENLAKMAERVLRAVRKGIKKYPGRNLVFLSHQDPIAAALLKISKRDFNDLHKVKAIFGTGSVSEVCSVGKKLINKTYLAP